MDTLLFALMMVAVTVILHIIGTSLAITFAERIWKTNAGRIGWLRMEFLMTGVISILSAAHFLEAGLWAALYCDWQILPDYSTSFYYSLTSYTTVGYGDIVLPKNYRILGPVESLMGVLMIGWSTAIIVAFVGRYFRMSTDTMSEQPLPR